MLSKHLALVRIQWQNGLVYRVNFVMWRARNVIQCLTLFFFWRVATLGRDQVLGYQEEQIFTYVFGILLLRSLILSSRTVDVAGDITQSSLSNKLIKPISYLTYWFTSDLSDKVLNMIFASFEFILLFWWLKPAIFFQTDTKIISVFVLSVALAFLLYFFINLTLGLVAFWTLEVWAPRFLFNIVLSFLAGGLFPIDILPQKVFMLLKLTPFPYLLYFPLEVYLGRVPFTALLGGLILSAAWTVCMWFVLRFVWQRGLRRYEAFGG